MPCSACIHRPLPSISYSPRCISIQYDECISQPLSFVEECLVELMTALCQLFCYWSAHLTGPRLRAVARILVCQPNETARPTTTRAGMHPSPLWLRPLYLHCVRTTMYVVRGIFCRAAPNRFSTFLHTSFLFSKTLKHLDPISAA